MIMGLTLLNIAVGNLPRGASPRRTLLMLLLFLALVVVVFGLGILNWCPIWRCWGVSTMSRIRFDNVSKSYRRQGTGRRGGGGRIADADRAVRAVPRRQVGAAARAGRPRSAGCRAHLVRRDRHHRAARRCAHHRLRAAILRAVSAHVGVRRDRLPAGAAGRERRRNPQPRRPGGGDVAHHVPVGAVPEPAQRRRQQAPPLPAAR